MEEDCVKRLQQEPEPEATRPNAGDYFIVSADNSTWYVSTEMARFIDAMLEAEPPVRWIKFVDLAGSRVRLRARQIEYVCQSTAEQRAMDREFGRWMTRERKADRSWDEED